MPKRRARVHQGIFQKKSLGLITKGKYSLIGHLLCRVLNWDFVFSSTQMETELVAVSWEKKELDGEIFESKLPGEVHLGVGVRVVEEAGMDHQVLPHWWLDQNQVRAGWHLIAWVEVQMQL